MKIEDRKHFIINFVYFLLIGLIFYFFTKYFFSYFKPLFIGFMFVFMLKPLSRFLSKKLKISYNIASVITLLIFYLCCIAIIFLSGWGIFLSANKFFVELPDIYQRYIEPVIRQVSNNLEGWIMNINEGFIDEISNYTDTIVKQLGGIATNISTRAVKSVTGLPVFLLSSLITVISSFFFASDYYGITNFIVRQFPEKTQDIIIETKNYIVETGFNLLKAYAILMAVTFVELSIGLSIIGINNALMLAFIIALFDILPVLGAGGVILPWALFEFINSNNKVAVGLMILYLIITIIRQMLESRIVGHQIGLPPIVTLASMYIGVRIFGGVGIIILPLIIITIKHLNDQGRIAIFK